MANNNDLKVKDLKDWRNRTRFIDLEWSFDLIFRRFLNDLILPREWYKIKMLITTYDNLYNSNICQ